ncbi:short-chain dehydrogenase [Bacillus sp. SG-1]|uniref:short-chain dehydrogenase n=1 Tax=Bacillus sp. SG-1 TaxID=161544 RepID=UPI0002FF1712|nr:short-chain dehydrogenase [Bacillus sp. SG-1]
MKESTAYLTILLVFSFFLFLLITGLFETQEPAIVFLLSIIAVEKLLEKNQWLLDAYVKSYNSNKKE